MRKFTKTIAIILTAVLVSCAFFATFTASADVAATTFKLVATDNGDGTVTVTAAVPAGVASGKLVLTASDKLTYVAGSLKSTDSGYQAANDAYNQGDVAGQCVVFADANGYDEGTVVFTANYKKADGAEVTAADFAVNLWNLSNGAVRLATQKDGDVDAAYVPAGEAPSEAPSENPSEAPSEAPSEDPSEAPSEAPSEQPSEEPSDAPVDSSADVSDDTSADESGDTSADESGDISGDVEYILGDVNGDGNVNNIDATQVLQHDSAILTLEGPSLAAADTNADGAVNNIDAARILQLDAGIIDEF